MTRALLLSLIILATACRTVQKASSSANTQDMSAESSKYNREIITEYVVRDTATGKPVIVNVTPGQPTQIGSSAPVIVTQKEPYIIRQTIRESGEQQAVKSESTQTETKEKETGMPMLLQIAALIFAGSVAIIALVLLLRQIRPV